MTGSAIINALAFTGGNMLGSMVFGRKAEEERRKRDVAMRQQQEEHEKWEQSRARAKRGPRLYLRLKRRDASLLRNDEATTSEFKKRACFERFLSPG